MAVKIRLFLLLTVLVMALYHVQGNKMCDWPRGTCTYIYDPCPPNWERCPQYDYDCPVKTNHCCCRKKAPHPTPKPKPKPKPNVCDWPRGTCTYIHDPCPPNWERCPQYDRGCTLSTNHCCCRKNPPKSDGNKMCDWPRRTCTYYKDPCPPNWERCSQYDYDCPVATNHCCCRKKPRPTTPKPKPNVCDWPRGTCTYIHDPCPPDWERCPQYDGGCKLSTNHCCCRKNPPKSDVQDAPKCDWPKGICTFVGDPCPENMERCSQNDKGCSSATNHCCCYVKKAEPVKDVPKVEVLDKPCDWPNGTCTYTGDPCPPNWVRCPSLDSGCHLPTNHCCCRTSPTPPPGKCDWPRGTCTYVGDPCPPGWNRCPDYDIDCELKSNHCCCHS